VLADTTPSPGCTPTIISCNTTYLIVCLQMIQYYFSSDQVHRSMPYGRKVRCLIVKLAVYGWDTRQQLYQQPLGSL
jgi:hypothetical protein